MITWADNANFLFDNPEAFYDEILAFAEREFNVQLSPSEIRTLTLAQQAVMPRAGREYPYEVSLDHDFQSYIDQIKTAPSVESLEKSIKRLSEMEGGKLTVAAEAKVVTDTFFQNAVYHSDQWELPSPLRFY